MADVVRSGIAHCNSEKCETPLRVEMVPRAGYGGDPRWNKGNVEAPVIEPTVFEWDGQGDSLFVSKNGDQWRCMWCGKRISDFERIRDVMTHQEGVRRTGLHV